MKNMKTRSLALFICNVSIIAMVLVPFTFMVNIPEAQAAAVTVNCSGTSGSPTAVTEGDLNADDVTFSDSGGDGYCALDEAITAASVLIEAGVVLTHTAEDVTGVTITTTGNFEIESGASIDTDAKGCPNNGTNNGAGPNGSNVCGTAVAGWGDGSNVSAGMQGAHHGGEGGVGSDPAYNVGGVVYGSVTAPSLFGSSGGSAGANHGGTGGGLIKLTIGETFTHNGSVSADATAGSSSTSAGGGGSGGSIYISVTGALAGSTGAFSADGGAGGDGSSDDGGGGGGGRISLNYGSSSFVGLGSEDLTVAGGAVTGSAVAGDSGTVYVKDTGANAVTIYHGFNFDNTDYSVTNWTVDASADNMYCDTGTATPSVTASGILAWDGTLSCDISTITSFNLSGATAFTVGSGASFSVAGAGADVDFNIPAGDDQTWTNFNFTGAAEALFTIDDAIDVELVGTSTIAANAQWTTLTGLNIGSSASINANAKGCLNTGTNNGFGPNGSNVCTVATAGWGDGSGVSAGMQGAHHGGAGGVGSDPAYNVGGATYGSATVPALFGSSGGSAGTSYGGTGGGYIRLIIGGSFTHNGSVAADGGVGVGGVGAGGGGSGGSIYINAGVILEDGGATGTFSVDGGAGGDGSSDDGGGGGGGRVSVEYGGDPDSLVAGLTAVGAAAGGTVTGTAVVGSTGTLSTVQIPVLTSITINDNNDSGYTNDPTPQITLVTAGATATHVAFSCNGGSNWSTWIEYPDDNVLNDGDGPVFDMSSDATTGCSATEESKTITAKVKDVADTESSTASDTTTYDTTAPTVSNVTATNADDTYGASIELTVTVQFDDNMAQSGTPQIELDFDGTDRQATYASLSTDTLSFTYTTVNGDNVSDLAYTGTGALTLNGGTITDLAGNTATLTLATPGEANSLSANKAIVVSTNQAPTVASVTAVQQSDGSVLITFEMNDPDADDTLEALVQYNVGGGLTKATVSETDIDTSANNGGDPKVENDDTYQVGNVSGYILTSSGANTVSTYWSAPSDESAIDISTATITVTPYDGITAGASAPSSSFNLDLTAPTVSSASYKDTDADGTVDRVDIVFDETIVVTSYDTTDWSFSAAGSITLDDSGASASTATVLLTVSADAEETGGATAPTVLYTNNGSRLTDAFGNAAATMGGPQTVTDAAAPQIKNFDYLDADADGKIDTIDVDFTETLDAASVLDANDLTLTNVGDFTAAAFGTDSTDLVTTGVTNVNITLGTESTAADTAEGSSTIAISSQNTFSLTDGTNTNAALGAQSGATFTDQAAPQIKKFEYRDIDKDGRIDRTRVTFTETVLGSSNFEANDLSFTNVGDFTGAAFGTDETDLITDGLSAVNIDLGTEATAQDTKEDSSNIAVSTQNTFSITDGVNTNTTLGAQTQATFTDGAAPRIKNVDYLDNDEDGKIDRVNIDFSETLDAASNVSANDLLLSNVGDFTGAAFGSNDSDLVVGAVDNINIDLGTEATVADTAEGSGTIEITTQNGISLSDGTNVTTNKAAQTQASFTDQAAPQIKNFDYIDLDIDGQIDTINVDFTETLDAASILDANDLLFTGVGDFTGALFGTDSTDLVTTGVTSVNVTLGTESTAVDTEENAGTIAISSQNTFSLTDGTNTNITLGGQAAATFTDQAAPAIDTIAFADTGTADGIIDQLTVTFSENVDTDDSVAPVLADFGTITLPDGQTASSATISDPAGSSAVVTLTSVVGQTTENTAVGSTAIAGITTEWTDGTNETTNPDGSITFTDSAAPHISTIAFADAALDGLIDTLTITFSENVDTNDSVAPVLADFGTLTLPDGQTVSAATISDPAGASAVVTLTSVVGQTTENTAAGSIAISGVTVEWEDVNALETTDPDTGVVFTDSAAPHISTAVFEDTATADGLIDKLTVTFSEAVDTNDGVAPVLADFGTITLPDGQTASSASITDPAGASAVVTLTAIAGQVTENTAVGSLGIAGMTTEWEDVNALETTNPDTSIVFTDSAKPFMTQIGYRDSDADGQIDSAVLAFSEVATIVYDDGDWVAVANDLTSMDVSAIASGNGTASITFTATAGAGITGGSTQPTIAFTPTTGSIQDAATNATAAFTATSFVDEAKPVITSMTPVDDTIAQSRTNDVVFNFSEPMTATAWVEGTTGYNSTPDSSGWSGAWSGTGNIIYTLSHSPFICVEEYVLTTTEADIVPTNGEAGYITLDETGTGNAFDGTLTFSTMACSGTSTSNSSNNVSNSDTFSMPVTDDIDVVDSSAVDINSCSGITPGSKVKLSWSVTSGVGFVNLYYSTDQGETYASIEAAAANVGSYSWSVPDSLAGNSDVQFKIEGTDLVEITSTYETGLMDVCEADASDATDTSDTTDDGSDTDESDTSDSSADGDEVTETVVPIGMAIESTLGNKWVKEAAKRNVDTTTFPTQEVAVGSLVKLPNDGDLETQADSAVYYIGADHRRHPFPNATVYTTWFTSFHSIVILDAETMSSIPMGPMVTYRPGSTLVKFPSVNKVYAVDEEGNLRWIASEELVQALYGNEWNEFVVDISEAFYSSYTFGGDLSSMSDMVWDTVMALYRASW